MRRPSCFSIRSALAALACVASVAPLCGAQVRPPVTIDVHVTGAEYRRRLDDEGDCIARCAAMETALRDSVRAIFERRFGFLDWRSAPKKSPDTVDVAWVNSPTNKGNVEVTLVRRGVRVGAPMWTLPFEGAASIMDRPTREWNDLPLMRTAWLQRLRELVDNPSFARELTHRVLSQISFKPLVDMQAPPGIAVKLNPRMIRADPNRNPIFLVRVDVIDPATGDPANQKQDITDMSLTNCSQSVDKSNYLCQVEYVAYPAHNPADTVKSLDGLARIARETRRTPVALRLWEFFPASPGDDAPIRQPR